MRLALLAFALVLAIAPTALAASHDVKAMGGFFSPDSLSIAPGDEVIWTNDDSMPHSITSTWDSGQSFDKVLRNGESFSWTFNQTGNFTVHCRPHAYPNESGGMDGMAMNVHVASADVQESRAPVPGPTIVLVLLGVVCASVLLRSRR